MGGHVGGHVEGMGTGVLRVVYVLDSSRVTGVDTELYNYSIYIMVRPFSRFMFL